MPGKLENNQDLDPVFECFFLLCTSLSGGYNREEYIQEISEYGANAEKIYNKHFAIAEQYHAAFAQHRVSTTADSLFQNSDTEYMVIVAHILCNTPSFTQNLSTYTEEQVRTFALEAILNEAEMSAVGEPPLFDNFIPLISESSLSDTSKWKLTLLVQNPKEQLMRFVDAIRQNIPAYQKAKAKVQKKLDRLLSEFNASSQNIQHKKILKLTHSFATAAQVFPTLAIPASALVFHNRCYYGLLVDTLSANNPSGSFTYEELLFSLKALGDKSKFDILSMLKAGAKYNLEIAESMNLTAATVSHHMGVLLNIEFVEMEKRDGKVYYRLVPATIRNFLQSLEEHLF